MTDHNCQDLARNVVKGTVNNGGCKHFLHMLHNYRFYLQDLLENDANMKKEIFVVRTEAFYDDLQKINVILGGADNIDQYKRKPHTHRGRKVLAVSNSEVSKEGK